MTASLFVKLGGSILTDKTRPEAIDLPTLHGVVAALAEVRREQPDLRLLIGHGGGSYGHYWAEKYGTQHGVTDQTGWHGVVRVADAMGRLNRAIVAALLDAGMNAIGIQPSASAIAERGTLRTLELAPIERLLRVGVVPVVCGDVVVDTHQGAAIISTEALFAYLAPRLQPSRIVLVGESAVFSADPRHDPQATRIAQITSANIETVLRQTGVSHGTDVTGGMASKVRQMWALVDAVPNVEVQLVGADPDVIRRVLRGERDAAGTTIKR